MVRQLKRRRFLQALLGCSTMLGCRAIGSTHASSTASDSQIQVLVVGAGIAGLGAASTLQAAGYRVVVLEARDRLGGRIWTNRSLNRIPLDLGASWIHGVQGNPLSKLVQQYQIQTQPTNYSSITRYNRSGAELSANQESQFESTFEQIMERVEAIRNRRQSSGAADVPLQQALDQAMRQVGVSQTNRQAINYWINTEIEHEYAADVSQLSLFEWDAGKAFRGRDVLFPDGYDQIITRLAAELPIRRQQIVKAIAYDANGVQVVTHQGSFSAERVLITVPLGVLKQGAITFSPPLPDDKQQAIQNLGMGVLNKVYLRFPEPFWEDEDELFGYIAETKGKWAEFLNFHAYSQQPILLGFNAATYGTQLEQQSNVQIVRSVMEVLRTIYGSRIPEPTGQLITRWKADPFAGGSYSYVAINSRNADRRRLAQPVGNRVFFAGEATSVDYAATVHGALLSGQRAAEEIISLLATE